tara:strand:+ start:59 stop:487 length:429 start_codon:yes stop_codon:yes gene_type:complete
MSSRAIVPITCKEYKPTFDITSGEYYDESPVNKGERNSIIYICPCKSGSNLRTRTQFIKHFGTDHHKSYLKKYSNIVENEKNEDNEKNELKKEIEFLKRDLEKKDKKIEEKDKKIEELYIIIVHIENIIGVKIGNPPHSDCD